MQDKYIKGKGVFVGEFNEAEVSAGVDKAQVEKKKKETGLGYTNTQLVRKNGTPVGLKIWVCTASDCRI